MISVYLLLDVFFIRQRIYTSSAIEYILTLP